MLMRMLGLWRDAKFAVRVKGEAPGALAWSFPGLDAIVTLRHIGRGQPVPGSVC
jgi:hypothetical protein